MLSFASFVLLAVAAQALPAPGPLRPRGVTIPGASRLHRRTIEYLSQEPAHVYTKFTNNVKLIKENGVSHERRGTVSLQSEVSGGVDELYYGGIQIGTPYQTVVIDPDTGSSDLWVPNQPITNLGGGYFNALTSSTYKPSLTPFEVTYGSGAVVGTLASDRVSFGNVSVDQQYFGSVTIVSPQFIGGPSAGLLGLAFQSIASSKKPPLAFSAGIPEFGFRLTRGGANSELDFGAVNPARFTGSFMTTPVTSKTYWEVASTGAFVNGKSASAGFSAAIDSGTTLIYLPTSAAKSFYAAIPGARATSSGGGGLSIPGLSSASSGSYEYPCNFTGTLALGFQGIADPLQFSRADFNIGQGSSTEYCQGAVMGLDIQDANGQNFAIVGDVFMKACKCSLAESADIAQTTHASPSRIRPSASPCQPRNCTR